MQGNEGTLGSVLFIHGYATTFERSIKAAAKVMVYSGSSRPIVAFSWPSLGQKWAYLYDKARAEASVRDMMQIIQSYVCSVRLQ